MGAPRMHEDEVSTDIELVRRLLAGQFPRWAGLPIEPVSSYGTDHAIYRLGDGLVARLPRIAWAAEQAVRDAEWLPRLAPHLPLAVPAPLALGEPADGYPFRWSVCPWLPGANADDGVLDDPGQAAADLAGFVTALRGIDTTGAPRGGRARPLAEADARFREAVAELGDRIDGPAVLRAWAESVEVGAWAGPDLWLHGDLLPGNLIVHGGRLTAVIDFGTLTSGDPAADLLPAWALFTGASRLRYRAELDADEASWLRGRGRALGQAVFALQYYWDTNPGMVRLAWRELGAVLDGG
jgi:aminoglycoside phosphotransferase (APT) family kinase protein